MGDYCELNYDLRQQGGEQCPLTCDISKLDDWNLQLANEQIYSKFGAFSHPTNIHSRTTPLITCYSDRPRPEIGRIHAYKRWDGCPAIEFCDVNDHIFGKLALDKRSFTALAISWLKSQNYQIIEATK